MCLPWSALAPPLRGGPPHTLETTVLDTVWHMLMPSIHRATYRTVTPSSERVSHSSQYKIVKYIKFMYTSCQNSSMLTEWCASWREAAIITGWHSHISSWGVQGRCIMPLPLLALHSFRTPVLFILRGCGLMRNDEGREAAEWVGIHMLRSTGNPLLLYMHTHTQIHTCLHVPMPPAPEKPYRLNVQCPLSVNISSIPTLMWQNITRAQNKQSRQCRAMKNSMCNRRVSSSSIAVCILITWQWDMPLKL